MEINPRVVFERMFGAIARPRKSVDPAREEHQHPRRGRAERTRTRIVAAAWGADRSRISDYMDNVREIERRIDAEQQRDETGIEPPPTPVGIPRTGKSTSS